MTNIDPSVVKDFGKEWEQFNQTHLSAEELQASFDEYFSVFPWESLPARPVGFDLGCGSGRWAKLVAPRVGELHCIDPSEKALEVARDNLAELSNCVFHLAEAAAMPLPDNSMDFGYSLGVLHHIPEPAQGVRACVAKLKTGAPFLLYLYYRFDDRPKWFISLWKLSNALRKFISALPYPAKYLCSQLIAGLVYFPLARLARLLEKAGFDVHHMPLSYYRNRSYYTMRTDALDRFGTRLEHRFTRAEIVQMLEASGLTKLRFREGSPFWCVVGFKK